MWHGIEGHDGIVEQFRQALARGRMATSFLFVGPSGIGKRTFAMKLAQSLLCAARPERDLDPCETCPPCVQVLAGTHPDMISVAKPAEKSDLPLELLIGDKEHRMREGLCHDIALKPFMGGRKVAILDDADYLNAEGANSLLKTLEEPPPGSVLILLGTSEAKQLPTIRSRCQIVRFRPLTTDVVARLLLRGGHVQDRAEAERLAGYSGGSLQRALELADPALWEFRGRLYEQLAAARLDSVRLARATLDFVEEAGREASPRRERLRLVVQMAAEFYRRLLRAVSGDTPCDDAELRDAVAVVLRGGTVDDLRAAALLDRTLEAAEQVDRNANQSTLVECWLDDLEVIQTSGSAAIR